MAPVRIGVSRGPTRGRRARVRGTLTVSSTTWTTVGSQSTTSIHATSTVRAREASSMLAQIGRFSRKGVAEEPDGLLWKHHHYHHGQSNEVRRGPAKEWTLFHRAKLELFFCMYAIQGSLEHHPVFAPAMTAGDSRLSAQVPRSSCAMR